MTSDIMPHESDHIVSVFKPVSKTPLECIEKYKQRHPEQSGETISYAGRLDPMAEGIVLLLVGGANKKRREYEHFSKEYKVDVLVGFSTDTGDLMGKVSSASSPTQLLDKDKTLQKALTACSSVLTQEYPDYSSVKVYGKPLYWWARQGRLHEIKKPSHQIQIDEIELLSREVISTQTLLKYITVSVGSVRGDFRQEEIIRNWTEELNHGNNLKTHQRFSMRVSCGSGTYIRQLVVDIGNQLGTSLCVFKITRTRLGEFTCENSEVLW